MLTDAQREALQSLSNLCSAIGSANDADDRGYADQATRMRNDAQQGIEALLEQETWLHEQQPKLVEELRSSGLFSYRWSTASDLIGALLNLG